jgi:hypothetical protein
MNTGWKKRSAYLLRKVKRVKQGHLCVIFLALLVVTVLGLRQNNLTMIKLRDQVIEADKALDWGEVNSSAEVLYSYVKNHMNTDTGQIALQNLYNKDVENVFSGANMEIGTDLYSLAVGECETQLSRSGYQGYVDCVAEYVGVSNDQVNTPELPNSAFYYISFISPKLSFDLAGISLILTIVVFLTLTLRFLIEVALGVAAHKKKFR